MRYKIYVEGLEGFPEYEFDISNIKIFIEYVEAYVREITYRKQTLRLGNLSVRKFARECYHGSRASEMLEDNTEWKNQPTYSLDFKYRNDKGIYDYAKIRIDVLDGIEE